jgi:hypothetical protein
VSLLNIVATQQLLMLTELFDLTVAREPFVWPSGEDGFECAELRGDDLPSAYDGK